jgi:hypothetical protein
MAYYEIFEIRVVDKNGKVGYRMRNTDINEIESWEFIDEEHTKIFTKGGDKFIAKINFNDLTEICMALTDEYGRLFIFYPN